VRPESKIDELRKKVVFLRELKCFEIERQGFRRRRR